MQTSNTENHLAGAAVATLAPKAAELLMKIKPIANVVKKAAAFAGKIGLGGVTQDRFIARRDSIRAIFDKAGYSNLYASPNISFTQAFKVLAADIPNKLTSRSYEKEFNRLYKMTVARLNKNNPGFGDLYATYVPAFKMANGGNMYSEPITILQAFVNAYKPGTYKPGMVPPDTTPNNPEKTLMPDNSVAPSTATPTKTMAGISLDGKLLSIVGAVVIIIILVSLGNKK